MSDGDKLRLGSIPVIIVQSDTDPGDMGEPREAWSDEDGAHIVVVPSFDYWTARAAAPPVEEYETLEDEREHMASLGDPDLLVARAAAPPVTLGEAHDYHVSARDTTFEPFTCPSCGLWIAGHAEGCARAAAPPVEPSSQSSAGDGPATPVSVRAETSSVARAPSPDREVGLREALDECEPVRNAQHQPSDD